MHCLVGEKKNEKAWCTLIGAFLADPSVKFDASLLTQSKDLLALSKLNCFISKNAPQSGMRVVADLKFPPTFHGYEEVDRKE